MSLFALGDLHLSFSSDKPMDIFSGWTDYTERIKKHWNAVVDQDDTVVLVGDTSWATKIEETKADFDFIHQLPGKKILLKGNHDFWWSTASKMNEFFETNGFDDIQILHNNAFVASNVGISGTRGWMFEDTQHDEKIKSREAGRLERSICEAKKLTDNVVAFLHYPPVYCDEESENILEILHKYEIKDCYYGHIHGEGSALKAVTGDYKGIKFHLVSCDAAGFCPVLVAKD